MPAERARCCKRCRLRTQRCHSSTHPGCSGPCSAGDTDPRRSRIGRRCHLGTLCRSHTAAGAPREGSRAPGLPTRHSSACVAIRVTCVHGESNPQVASLQQRRPEIPHAPEHIPQAPVSQKLDPAAHLSPLQQLSLQLLQQHHAQTPSLHMAADLGHIRHILCTRGLRGRSNGGLCPRSQQLHAIAKR